MSVARVGLVVAFLLFAHTVEGQVAGTVADPTGRPVPDALVELWGPAGRLAGTGTNADGRFWFSSEAARTASAITVRRIGFSPQRLTAISGAPLAIVLLPFAVDLPALAATAAPACPIRDERNARALWTDVATNVRAFRLGGRRWSEARVAMGTVRPSDLGVVDTTRLGPGGMAAGGGYYDRQTDRMAREGYAVPLNGLRVPRFDAWEYPYLESLLAGHFVDPVFAARNDLAMAESSGDTIIVFCPRDRNQPSIEGYIRLDHDRVPASATWRFRTPRPEELAGGEVLFGRNGDAELVPLVGLFWRKRVFDFYQEWWEFHEWKSCETEPTNPQCQRR